MESVKTLIIGAGISGLATAAFLEDKDLRVLEADAEVGGYCKTVKKEGFTWDYSGHFFHFKRPQLEAWLRARIGCPVHQVNKRSFIRYGGRLIDFPFQKNIHQLSKAELVECLHDLYFAEEPSIARGEAPAAAPGGRSFKQMLYARFGRAICEKFLIPYNEKLYACDLEELDEHAMGRFFPHANLTDVVRNMRQADNASYNATFTYPEGGAIEFVRALQQEVPEEAVSVEEPVLRVDLERKRVHTAKREIGYQQLVSTAPFPRLLELCQVPTAPLTFSWNKVLVFNLGFDRKGPKDVHWIYYPDPVCGFYRVGFYDNIFGGDRLSIYVEVGFPKDAEVDPVALLPKVLQGLRTQGVINEHQLVAQHHVVMDPAYVHITARSLAEHARLSEMLRQQDVHSIGRYGRWTYCSIEDNLVEAHALAARLGGLSDASPRLEEEA